MKTINGENYLEDREKVLKDHFYLDPDGFEPVYFVASLKNMENLFKTAEKSHDKIYKEEGHFVNLCIDLIERHQGYGCTHGVFKRFKDREPYLVKAYKTQKGAAAACRKENIKAGTSNHLNEGHGEKNIGSFINEKLKKMAKKEKPVKIDFKTVHTSKCSQEQYNAWRSQDEKAIGTPKYQGLAYFHNYEYRHLLRDWSDFRELVHRKSFRLISAWDDPKAWPNRNDYGAVDNARVKYAEKNWHILYKAIHDSFIKEGLQIDGFSVNHTKIIAQTLHINEKTLIDLYHGQVKENLNMPNPLTIYFYSDPGHGWGGVPRAILTLLGIESYISACSYQVGDMVWLEEDCDISVLCMALINQSIEFKFIDIKEFPFNNDNSIKSCERYQP